MGRGDAIRRDDCARNLPPFCSPPHRTAERARTLVLMARDTGSRAECRASPPEMSHRGRGPVRSGIEALNRWPLPRGIYHPGGPGRISRRSLSIRDNTKSRCGCICSLGRAGLCQFTRPGFSRGSHGKSRNRYHRRCDLLKVAKNAI